jgi:hypothetical protein
MGALWLQKMFEVISVHFKADGSAPHGVLSNTPEHVGVDRCQSYFKPCHKIFEWS